MAEPVVTIAVDGPAASGKGTLARRLADHFGLNHLDTGGLYRAVAVRVLRQGGDPADEASGETAAQNLETQDLEAPNLRAEEVGQAASIVSAHPKVRAALLIYQRDFAATPPGAVLDGRDIGTVVCPDADAKLFITATVEVRAERRFKELRERGLDAIHGRVLADMEERDARDQDRAVSPLEPAKDAYQLDTSDLDADQVFAAALGFIRSGNG